MATTRRAPTAAKAKAARRRQRQDDATFPLPRFASKQAADTWWKGLPEAEIDMDERLKATIKTSIRLSRRTIEGFTSLARKKGIRSGQTLMKLVLEAYLAKHLPPEF
jgi:hypothetical protein